MPFVGMPFAPFQEIGVAGKFQEIQGLWRISTENTPIRGIPGNSFWGPHFGDLGGIFWGK